MSEYVGLVSGGETLSLAKNGNYFLGENENGFVNISSGSDAAPITVEGNGATIHGGLQGTYIMSDHLVFKDLHFRDQTAVCISVDSANDVSFRDCTCSSSASPGGFFDVFKVRNSSGVDFIRCSAHASLGRNTVDGFEFWGSKDCRCIDCIAEDLHNGPDEPNNGHGFECYGQRADEACTGIEFIDCEARNCRSGFSVESPNGKAKHEVSLVGCVSDGMSYYDYYCESPSTMVVLNCRGDSRGGDGTFVDVSTKPVGG